MAIRLVDQYPNRVGAPDSDYPHGVPRNRSAVGATDGTPYEQAWYRDQEGFFQGLLETADIAPSGNPDTVETSDYLDAMTVMAHGVLEVDMSGDEDITLGTYPSRVAALRLTGGLAADVDLIVPDTERLYTVIDETTGDFSVTVRTDGGTGVTLGYEVTALRCDGSDVVSSQSGLSSVQFANYNQVRVYETGEIARGSDGMFYEFYDRDGDGTVQGIDPTDSENRPHIWMRWYGERPGSVIEWRSETLPEGYIENDGSEISRTDYRRIFEAWGTTHGEGDGSTTFLLPDDRSEFKRGWDNGRGVDSGRLLAEHQKGSLVLIDDSAGNITVDVARGTLSSTGLDDVPASDYSGTTRSFVTTDDGVQTDSLPANNYGAVRPSNNAVIWLTKI